MPDHPIPGPTPSGYQRTTGGQFSWSVPEVADLQRYFPQYEIQGLQGQGGMGAVFRAHQKSLDRLVAIKVLPRGTGVDSHSFAERFKNEARTMARLDHPGIVHVHDFGETDKGLLYFVMEFIEGSDVQEMIHAQGALTPAYALPITLHVCDALAYAHSQGVIHRDIKPANIMLTKDGRVKVADFGLARLDDPTQPGLTQPGMTMGTPDYVAPEALTTGNVDARADLYAIGVMLYHMLAGEVPRGIFEMPSKRNSAIDPRIDAVIAKAMMQRPEERYQTATELRDDIQAILSQPQTASPAPAPASEPVEALPESPLRTDSGKKRLIWGAAATVLVVIGVIVSTTRTPSTTEGEAPLVAVKTELENPEPAPPPPKQSETSEPEPTPKTVQSEPAMTVTAGEWNPVRFKGNKPPKGRWQDGALILGTKEQCKLPPACNARDAAIRARLTVKSNDGSFKGVYFKLRNDHAFGFFDLDSSHTAHVGIQPDFKTDLIKLGTSAKDLIPLGKKDLLVEFAVVGDNLILAIEGKTAATGKIARGPQGDRAKAPFLALLQAGWNEATFRELEFMPLDGVSKDKQPAFIQTALSVKAAPPAATPPTPAPAPAKSAPKLPAELIALQKSYLQSIQKTVTGPHRTAFTQLNDGFISALDRAVTARQIRAKDVTADKQAIADKKPLPPDTEATPDVLKTYRATYRTKASEIDDTRTAAHLGLLTPFIASLRELEATLSKAGRVADVAAVKAYRDALSENPLALPDEAQP